MKLIYIGDEFYQESGTIMSSIYVEGTWERYDWGRVQRDLRLGKEIHIRPANDDELEIARKMLWDL